ncbi:DUF2867 domain-containing protein [Chryseobacterium sp. Mn2064]|uniref:DUF2867 domain-containing protein n=1 Tax=Chryseobacterium sp. Mn2064 TaxID=3395263 RepID=UPI003BE89589
MKIKKIELPAKSILFDRKNTFDYTDSFEGEMKSAPQNIDISEVGRIFFSSSPKWGKKMFAFRNKMVKLFGLKTGDNGKQTKNMNDFTCEIGEQVGIFKIFDKTDHEIIIGEDDKHLDFRVSLLYDPTKDKNKENCLTISTTVKFHNWLGVLYFLPVRPFHQLIVPAILKRMITQLNTTVA